MDELLLSKVRLSVVAELIAAEWVPFSELRKKAATTNGNLGTHLRKLLDGGYVEEQKRFVGRRPQSRYRLTETGRAALLRHVEALQGIVEAGSSVTPEPHS